MKRPENTDNFVYYNENPRGIHTDDCVIRAISTATGKTWDEVLTGLCAIALKKKMIPNEKRVFSYYLKSIGWVIQPTVKTPEGKGCNILEIALKGNITTPIIFEIRSHLSCFMNGKVYDTGDCSNEIVGNYYIKI